MLVAAMATPALTKTSLAQISQTPDKTAGAVYVRDSGVATEKLALAQRMERASQWDKSADVYQEIIEKYADRVVPTRTDAAGQPTQYTSVSMIVQEKLAKWPEAGLAAYRRRFDDVARDRLASAGDDSAALQRVMNQYFPTEAGKLAGLKLLAGDLERGQFALAGWVGRRLLTLHPSLAEERPGVLFETALAEHAAGNDAAANGHLDELRKNFPAALGTVRGVEVKLAAALADELASPPIMQAVRADSWPASFGSPGAESVPADVSKGGARLFTIDIPSPARRSSPGRNGNGVPFPSIDRLIGSNTGIFPAIDNGELFFQDNARVYGISLASGMALPGWAATYPGDKRGIFATEAQPMPRGSPLGICTTADCVVAVLGQPDQGGMGQMNISQQVPQLVCLDRQSGRRNWAVTLDRLKLPDGQATLKDGQFYGTPVVVGDSVYVMVRATRGGQFDESHVVSLRAANGAFQWSAYVASTSMGNRFMNFDDGTALGLGATGQLTCADGRLYVLTNLGAIACLDASDGKTLWLDVYPRAAGMIDRPGFIAASTAVKPFAMNPPILHGGLLFVMPQDSAQVLVYDAASGDLVSTVPRTLIAPSTHDPFEPADMLLAVVGQKMILGNRGNIFSLTWKNFDASQPMTASGGIFHDFYSSGDNDKDGIRGRPFVSDKFMFVTTGDKLYRMSIDQLKFLSLYPAQGVWDESESPGNVIATSDNLVVAGSNRVTVYADLGLATAKLDEQLTAAPDNVETFLRYAGLLFSAGRPNEGLAKIDQAIDKLGGAAALQAGPTRDHLFDLVLGFAVKLQKVDGTPPKLVQTLFDRASLSANSPEQQVRVRFALAAWNHQKGDVPGELALHQQILASGEWRRVPGSGVDGAYTAAAQAEAAIAQLIKDNGDAIYAPYAAAAAKRLDAIKASGATDPNQLLAVADEYPVATQALEALAMAADGYEGAHNPRQATRTLRRLLHSGLSNERKLITLQALARNYLAVPRQLDIAIVRLRQASQIAADAKLDRPLVMPDGKIVADQTIGQALAQASSYRDRSARQQLPTFGIPETSDGQDISKVPFKPVRDVLSATALIDQQDDLARGDRVVALGVDAMVHTFDSRSARPIASGGKIAGVPIGCGYVGETLIIVTPQTALAMSSNGKAVWELPLAAMPAIEAVAAPEPVADENKDAGDAFPNPRVRNLRLRNGRRIFLGPNGILGGGVIPEAQPHSVAGGDGPERITNFRLLSDRLLLGTTAGRLVSLGLADGKIDWQSRPADRPIRHFLTNDDFLAVSYGDVDGSTAVCIIDALGGQPVSREVFDGNNRQITNLALSPDGVLVTMTPTQLTARDLYEPSVAPWTKTVGNPNQGDIPFRMSAGAEQLVITDDRVLALYATNGNQQSVKAYDLRTLQPMKIHDAQRNRDVEASYSPMAAADRANAVNNGGDQTPISIAAAGPAFYLIGAHSLAAYNLDRPDSQWADPGDKGLTRDVAICSDFAVQINQLANAAMNADTVAAVQLTAFGRSLVASGAESGNLEQRVTIRDAVGLVAGQWQVSDGAFYYLSAGHKLKVLAANP